METRCGDFLISDDTTRLQPAAVHAYLSSSYWSENIPLETVRHAMENSFCIGAYENFGAQVGLIRVISDYATYAYLCDVFVLEAHRGRGLSKAMMAFTLQHPRLQGLRTWNLRTRDAHGLYAQFGFQPIENHESYMVLRLINAYAPEAQKPST